MFKLYMNDVKNWFAHSETLLWTRLQIAAGIVWGVLAVTDMSPIITSPKWFAVWGIANGIIGELLRRRNTRTITTLVPVVGAPEMVKVTVLQTEPITKV